MRFYGGMKVGKLRIWMDNDSLNLNDLFEKGEEGRRYLSLSLGDFLNLR